MRIPHKLPYPSSGSTDTPADKITLIAQRYSGFFIGHDYRFDQQSPYTIQTDPQYKGIHVDKKAWKEPLVISDNCEFCKRLTDEEVIRKVAGFQHQLDIEVLRGKQNFYQTWLMEAGPDVVEFIAVDETHIETEDEGSGLVRVLQGKEHSAVNRRAFIRTHQDVPRKTRIGNDRPDGWHHKSLPMVDLPLRLKRKMCIEWVHVYTDYMAEMREKGVELFYDFERKSFFKEMPDPGPSNCCGGMQAYDMYGNIVILHKDGCEAAKETMVLGYNVMGMIQAMHGYGSW